MTWQEYSRCYDKNNMEEMRKNIGYCLFILSEDKEKLFLFDLIQYIKQCSEEQHHKINNPQTNNNIPTNQ